MNGYFSAVMFRFIAAVILATNGALPLKIREVSVPAVVMKGDAVRLGCSFELGPDDKLYSVKWHKDSVEFYRHLPEHAPAGQKYPLDGIYLDLSRSKEGHIFMNETDIHSEGIYRCEVSTDAPSFQTMKGEGEMRIYVFPSEGPQILGHKSRYGIGEEVDAKCISSPSRPGAFLKWYINGNEAASDQLIRIEPEETKDGLIISRLGLRFTTERSHFSSYSSYDEQAPVMKLHCEAIISQAHKLTSEELLVPQNATINEYDKSTVRTFSSIPRETGPSITGSRPLYRVGDEINLSCSGPKSQPPAELHWYMNNKKVRPEHLVKHPPTRYPDGQESAVLGLKFEVKQRYFLKGQPMRLRCTAAALSEGKRMHSPVIEIHNSNYKQQVSGLHVYEKSLAVSENDSNRATAHLLGHFLILIQVVRIL